MAKPPNRPRVDIVHRLPDPVHSDDRLREAAQEILNQRERANVWIKSSEGWKMQLRKCEAALAAKSREVERLRAIVDALSGKAANGDACS